MGERGRDGEGRRRGGGGQETEEERRSGAEVCPLTLHVT